MDIRPRPRQIDAMKGIDPDWTAPLAGNDWRDDTTLVACAWLESLADPRTWSARYAATERLFEHARVARLKDEAAAFFDPSDSAAWYIFQARGYAQDRNKWVPEEAVRIVPTLVRIGTELERLLSIPGAEDVGRRLMNKDRRQPDDGLFELLVALAYKRHGWSVAFVPAAPGGARTHDLDVWRGRSRWAVECKRMIRSNDHLREAAAARKLAAPVHALALAASRSVAMKVAFEADPADIPGGWLARRLEDYLANPRRAAWRDEYTLGVIDEIDFRLMRKVMTKDDVYYGSSRMIELLLGTYDHQLDHSMAAKWRPSGERPFWAEAVYQASVVSWGVVSAEATMRKARHFRRQVARAGGQLPQDRPGVIHVGIESWAGDASDYFRHIQNHFEARDFNIGASRLRWIYGNYFAPEVTTRFDESWAMDETMAPYRVGRHSTRQPLPSHLLISPDHGESLGGAHWVGRR